MIFIRFLILLPAVFLTNCEKPIEWDIDYTAEKTIVVNSILTNEFTTQKIYLHYTLDSLNAEPEPVTDATVWVITGLSNMPFVQSDSIPGLYISAMPAAATVDREYQLIVKTNSNEYSAITHMEPVFPATPPSFDRNNTSGLFRINWGNDSYSPFEQAMYEAFITWNHLPGYDHPDSINCAHLINYTFNTIDVSYQIFPQDKERAYFPSGSVAYLTKYSLTKEYASYLRGLVSETQWQGSLFETSRGNPAGNIDGGMGFFAACAVLRDTLIVGN
jgi:hypothetical protein